MKQMSKCYYGNFEKTDRNINDSNGRSIFTS